MKSVNICAKIQSNQRLCSHCNYRASLVGVPKTIIKSSKCVSVFRVTCVSPVQYAEGSFECDWA